MPGFEPGIILSAYEITSLSKWERKKWSFCFSGGIGCLPICSIWNFLLISVSASVWFFGVYHFRDLWVSQLISFWSGGESVRSSGPTRVIKSCAGMRWRDERKHSQLSARNFRRRTQTAKWGFGLIIYLIKTEDFLRNMGLSHSTKSPGRGHFE